MWPSGPNQKVPSKHCHKHTCLHQTGFSNRHSCPFFLSLFTSVALSKGWIWDILTGFLNLYCLVYLLECTSLNNSKISARLALRNKHSEQDHKANSLRSKKKKNERGSLDGWKIKKYFEYLQGADRELSNATLLN